VNTNNIFLMHIFLIFFLILLSFTGTALVKWITVKMNLMDVPNDRSSHRKPTPKGGGIAVVAIFYLGLVIEYFVYASIDTGFFIALLFALPVAVVSLRNDLRKVSPWIRLFVQILAGSAALYFLGGIDKIDLGFVTYNHAFIFNIIAPLGIVWFTNLFNFIDGIDGYIGSEVIFISVAFFILSGSAVSLIPAAATLGFLVLNWQPAKIFMSDVGSTFIGFVISIFAIHSQNTGELSLIAWAMLTSVFWFDATVTLIRRMINREAIFNAHRKHAYQRIIQFGFSHQKTVICAMSINIIIFLMTLLSVVFPDLIMVFFMLNMILLALVMYMVDKRYPFRINGIS
jgi:UDP-N-acetylmuramyl pentapeptide phosphotransferase/UDP-N-acetylglucosamine-1-phosphate transferase